MTRRQHKLHDGRRGSALAIRVIPNAKKNRIAKILKDGTIQVKLVESEEFLQMNLGLIDYLSTILGVPKSKVDIIAGHNGRDKLVSIMDLNTDAVHQIILNNQS